MGYKVKRGSSPTGPTIKNVLLQFMKRLLATFIILALMMILGYFLFHFAYVKFHGFAEAADDVIRVVKNFYSKHGIWITIGAFIFVCLSVWALGEEWRRKERRKQAMNEMMK